MKTTRNMRWQDWVTLILGLWLVVAPFVLGFTLGGVAMWSSVIIGLFVAGDALWAALTAKPTEESPPRPRPDAVGACARIRAQPWNHLQSTTLIRAKEGRG
jgi:hypothetical protein